MKEVVTYVAIVMMEFKYEDGRDLTYGTLDTLTPPPLPRPEAIGKIVQ